MLPNEHIIDRVVQRLKARGLPDISTEMVEAAVHADLTTVLGKGFTYDDYTRIRDEITEYGVEVVTTTN